MTPASDRFITVWCATLLLTLAGYLGLVAATSWRPGQDYVGAVTLPEDDAFHTGRFGLDHALAWHGIGSMTRNLKAADVVFLGHSRLYFGLHSPTVAEFAERHQVRLFSLGMLAETGGDFSLRIIEKHKVRARLFVINADDDLQGSFFSDPPTALSQQVLAGTRLGTYATLVLQSFVVRITLAVLPVAPADFMPRLPYRSIRDGTIHFARWPRRWDATNPVMRHFREDDCRTRVAEYPLARLYIQRLLAASPDASVALTLVPHPWGCARRVRALAAELGIPFVYADPSGLTLNDGSHLDDAGAKSFTSELLRQIESLNVFKVIDAAR